MSNNRNVKNCIFSMLPADEALLEKLLVKCGKRSLVSVNKSDVIRASLRALDKVDSETLENLIDSVRIKKGRPVS